MATGRDDFVIAFRSAFLKKKDKQKFSLLSLILLSIFVLFLSNINFKPISYLEIGIKEIIYRSSYIVSKPENYLNKLIIWKLYKYKIRIRKIKSRTNNWQIFKARE